MAIASLIDSTKEPRSFSIGPIKFQIVDFVINSGATSGTIQADRLSELMHLVIPGEVYHSAAPTYSSNIATLAFTVKAETASSETIDGILYTAVANLGAGGDAISVELVDGTGDDVPVTPGNEVVVVTGNAIVVRIDPTAITGSTRDQVKAAVLASSAALALLTPSTVTSGSTVAAVTAATPLAGGVTGGARGTAICIGK